MTTSKQTLDKETLEFEARVEAQLKTRATLVGGTDWGVTLGKPRIYLRSRKDINVFVEYPDYPTGANEDLLGGPKLSVFVDEYSGQHANWYRAEWQKAVHSNRRALLALAILADGDARLAADLMESDGDLTDAMMDEAAHHSVNGRFAEARKALEV
jgi:hypothetical protein